MPLDLDASTRSDAFQDIADDDGDFLDDLDRRIGDIFDDLF